MKRIGLSALIATLVTGALASAQTPSNALYVPGASQPVSGQYSHAANYHRAAPTATCDSQTCDTGCDSACPSCGHRFLNLRDRSSRGQSCSTCGTDTGCESCPSCGHRFERLHNVRARFSTQRSGNLARRVWDWLCWSPKASECDWHTTPSARQPDGWEYFGCTKAPPIESHCGPRERRDWSLHLNLRNRKCPTCGGCATGEASNCGPNGCAPTAQVAPTPPAAPMPHISYSPNAAPAGVRRDAAPGAPPAPAQQMIPGFRSTNVDDTRYANPNYPQPVPSNYSLPPISLPLTKPQFDYQNYGYLRK